MEIQKEIKELREKLESLEKQISSKHEFAKGWNYLETYYSWLVLNPSKHGNRVKFQIAISNFNSPSPTLYKHEDWTGSEWGDLNQIKSHRPATPSEIKDALVKVCEKMGIVPGINIKPLPFGSSVIDSYSSISWYYDESDDDLQLNGTRVYYHGKFATVVKDEVIKIGGYEVKFSEHTKDTKIDGNLFTYEFWQAAKLISEHSKAKVMIGCSKQFDVSLDTINKILNKLNQ